jgi:multidrug resistance efflux pump
VRIAVVVIALGSLAGLLTLGQGFRDTTPPPAAAAQVAARPVERGSDKIAADGVVEGARPESSLRPDVAGTLSVVHVREGQQVKKGQVLAELRHETQTHQVALARAELAIASARLAKLRSGERVERRKALAAVREARAVAYRQAKGSLERTQRLFEKNQSISRDEYDRDYFAVERARAELEEAAAEHALVEAPPRVDEVAEATGHVAAAEAQLKLAEAELSKTRMVAPTDGTILRVYAEPGEVAGPATEQPVLLMADLSRLRVRAFVEELDATRVRPGQSAVITADGLPGREFVGKVSQVAPRMGRRAPQTDDPGEYKDLYFLEVLVDPDDAHELPLNLRVQARIKVDPEAP